MHALLELIFSFLKVNDMEAVIWFLFMLGVLAAYRRRRMNYNSAISHTITRIFFSCE